MRLQHTQITGLLGAIVLSAGLTASVAAADETSNEQSSSAKDGAADQKSSADASALDQAKDGMVQVRVSLPDGRTIITYERATKMSARVSPAIARHMLGHGGVGSQRSSASSSAGHRSPGSSSGRSSGGSGGGSFRSSGSSGSSGSSSSSGSSAGGASESGGSAGGSHTQAGSGSSSGVATFSRSSGSSSSAGSAGSAGSSGSSNHASTGTGSGRSGQGSSPTIGHRTIHTVGGARYDAEGAVGGQRVEFSDAGMSAVVVGSTIYFTGVQLVQANQSFDALEGTRIGADSVIMQEGRLGSGSTGPLGTWNPGSSAIMLDFERNSVVELIMFSEPENSITPEREQRTWTVRIR